MGCFLLWLFLMVSIRNSLCSQYTSYKQICKSLLLSLSRICRPWRWLDAFTTAQPDFDFTTEPLQRGTGSFCKETWKEPCGRRGPAWVCPIKIDCSLSLDFTTSSRTNAHGFNSFREVIKHENIIFDPASVFLSQKPSQRVPAFLPKSW